jgi:acyl-CoA synthetase (AMP-forming)/AMP-acid ligase II
VEAAIYEHPDVHEAAVFGVAHPRLGEEVAACVVPRAGRSIDGEALRAFLAAHLAPFKIPSRIRICEEALPRNPAGKILKRALRDALAGG